SPAEPTPDQATAERHRQHAYDGGIDALQAAQRKLADATDHRDEHARRAERAIRDSIDHDGLKDSWWDKFTNWVHEHADLLRAIAHVAELVAAVLGAIALVISFIPVLNLLSPGLFGLAALASGVALVCNLMLALAGDGSWFSVAVDLVAVIPFGFAARGAFSSIRAFMRARSIKGVNPQKQAGHIKGTPQYKNRIKQNKPTSAFNDRATAERLTREAWIKGKNIKGRPGVREHNFGTPVGTGPSGGSQSRVRVHMDRNGHIHGHPSGPESP
ncbi:MAG: hypothetical protein ACRDTD_09490, partial [Pseudonocardiaceae bacterium]